MVGAPQVGKEDQWKEYHLETVQEILQAKVPLWQVLCMIKQLHELRLGQQTMEEYANKFLELLKYVRYIKDEKVKVHHFLSGLPQSYKDRIEFYEPRTL